MAKPCYIFAGGAYQGKDFYRQADGYFIICADSGLDFAVELGLNVDLVVGDLDSVSENGLGLIKSNRVDFQASEEDQDMTDTQIAIEAALARSFTEIRVFGATGSRLDHSLSNILALYKYRDKNIRILDPLNEIGFLSSSLSLDRDDSYYSFLPLSKPGIRLSLEGFTYNLANQLIELGSSLGVSNRISADRAQVKVHQGYGLMIKSEEE